MFNNSLDIKLLIPLISPLITIFLGILTIPFIDNIKNHYEKKKLINLLLSEIDDEIESISSIAKSSLKFIDSINYYLNINRDISFNIIFPPEINIYSINKILENHYTQITYEQRSTLKLIKSTIIFLNDKSEKIKKDFHLVFDNKNKKDEKILDFRQLEKDYIYALMGYRYNLIYISKNIKNLNSNLLFSKDISNDDAVKIQLEDLGLEKRIHDLLE